MERALALIASEKLTIAVAHASKGKTVSLPRSFNQFSGKESRRQTGFSDSTWGKATRAYAKTARTLAKDKFDAIIQAAQPFVNPKPNRVHKTTTDTVEVIEIDDNDERACLHSDDDDDDDCKLFYYYVTSLITII